MPKTEIIICIMNKDLQKMIGSDFSFLVRNFNIKTDKDDPNQKHGKLTQI